MWTITTFLNGNNYYYSKNGIVVIFIYSVSKNCYCSRVYEKCKTQVSTTKCVVICGETLEEVMFLCILKARNFGWDINFDEVIKEY